MGIYDLSVETDHDERVSLSLYSGKVLLIVNSATNCIFTPQLIYVGNLVNKKRRFPRLNTSNPMSNRFSFSVRFLRFRFLAF